MRRADLTPMDGHYGNWTNGAYGDWINYLEGKLPPERYVASSGTYPDYHFRDAYGLHLPAANFKASGGDCYFSSTFINPLAARYYLTQDTRALAKWLAVTRDIAVNERAQVAQLSSADLTARRDCIDVAGGVAGALLANGSYMSASLTAMAAMAKAAGSPARSVSTWSSEALLPVDAPLTEAARSPFPAQTVQDIATGFARHYAPHLLNFYEKGRAPNQRLIGFGSLALLTHFFELEPSVAALAPRLDADLGKLVSELSHLDGGMLEQSFNYADGTVEEMRRLTHIGSSRPWDGRMREAVAAYDLQRAALATPQGGRPQVGNNHWSAGNLPGSGMRFGMSSVAFPYSGYYVQRSSWDKDAAYLFFFVRRAASGHSMAASNSVQLGTYGRRLLIAGGSPNYNGKNEAYPASPTYLAEDSTYKTSTVLVDGQSQAGGSVQGLRTDPATGKPTGGMVPLVPVASRWLASESLDFVEGFHDAGYRPWPADKNVPSVSDVTHWRGIAFLRGLRSWVIVDILRSRGTHDYTQVWKLAAPATDARTGARIEGFLPDEVRLSDADRRVVTTDASPGSVNLSLRQFGANMHYARFHGADKGPYGYVGLDAAGGLAFSNDIHGRFSGTGDQVVITLVRPFQGGQGDGVGTAADVSANGIAGADLAIGSTRLSVRASATAADLSAAGQSAHGANLLLVESAPNQPVRTLVIGDAKAGGSSYTSAGGTTVPITVPTGFRWTTDGNGANVPAYTP